MQGPIEVVHGHLELETMEAAQLLRIRHLGCERARLGKRGPGCASRTFTMTKRTRSP
jgi:hypothetical protein